jgi:hypothetical protein
MMGGTLGSPVNGVPRVGEVGGVSRVGVEDTSVSATGSENSQPVAGYGEVDTPQQYQTQFGDSAYSKALTDRLVEESNKGKP